MAYSSVKCSPALKLTDFNSYGTLSAASVIRTAKDGGPSETAYNFIAAWYADQSVGNIEVHT